MAGRVAKRYLAVVRGWPAASGTIDHPLRDLDDGVSERRRRAPRPPSEAITDYLRIATVELDERVDRYPTSRYALLELAPRHGRKHQLRRHLKHLSHPLIGDSSYGKGRHNRLFAERFHCGRLLLHAWRVALDHPVTGEPLELQAPLGGCFKTLIERLGWGSALPD